MSGTAPGGRSRRLVFSTWVGLIFGGIAIMLAIPLLGR